jgi:hypothetical protein
MKNGDGKMTSSNMEEKVSAQYGLELEQLISQEESNCKMHVPKSSPDVTRWHGSHTQ